MGSERQRVAVIEVGSRAVRLLVADVSERVVEVGGATELTDLAGGLRESGDVLTKALSKVNFAVPSFINRAAVLGADASIVFGTAAIRALQSESAELPFNF